MRQQVEAAQARERAKTYEAIVEDLLKLLKIF